MAYLELTALARSPALLVRAAAARGIDAQNLLQAAGLRERDLRDLDARIAVGKLERLWQRFIELDPDPALGVTIGATVTARHLGLVGYTMLASRTLGAALERLRRYARVLTEAVQIEFTRHTDAVELQFDSPPALVALRHPIDSRVAIVISVARELTRVAVTPLRVRFPYQRAQSEQALRRFLRAPLDFGAGKAAIVFAPADLELPIAAGDEALAGYLDEYAALVLASFERPGSVSEQVQRSLATQLSGGRPSIQRMASELRISPRSMQRRLRAEGTTFAGLVDSVREAMAVRLIKEQTVAIKEIAFVLGYASVSEFHRAFRRWRKVSPHQFRSRHGGDG